MMALSRVSQNVAIQQVGALAGKLVEAMVTPVERTNLSKTG